MLRVGDPVAGSDQSACRNRWPTSLHGRAEGPMLSGPKRSRKDSSRPDWLRRGPVTTAGATGWPASGRCQDLTWPEGHRLLPGAPGGWWRDPSVKGGVHEQAGRASTRNRRRGGSRMTAASRSG
jgi:hypothetical protein